MMFLFLLLVLVLVHSSISVNFNSNYNITSNNGDGDLMYIFATTWTPEFCYNEETVWPGCASPEEYWTTHLTIHGLWPQYIAGGYPADCTTEPFDSNIPTEIGMSTMTQYWPDVKYSTDSPDYNEFWTHEWTKHGTCSGLTQQAYFTEAINLSKLAGTPSLISSNIGGTISASSLRDAYGGASYVSLQCSGGSYFVGTYTCYNRNTDGTVGAQTTCPNDVIAEDTCSATTISIDSL